MEDITLGLFTKTRSSHARLNVPALVQVAAFAIILIRALDLLMILNLLGLQGLNEFIHRSVQTWNLTLVFLGSLALVFVEIWCAFSLVKGRNWARWVYLLTQIIAMRLPVGGVAGLRVSGTVQHSRRIQTGDLPLAGDAKTAGSAGSDVAVCAA